MKKALFGPSLTPYLLLLPQTQAKHLKTGIRRRRRR